MLCKEEKRNILGILALLFNCCVTLGKLLTSLGCVCNLGPDVGVVSDVPEESRGLVNVMSFLRLSPYLVKWQMAQ